MTNDEIIKFLQSKQMPQCGDKEYTTDEEYEAYQRAIDAVEQTTWIPVSKKMPPIAQRVLVSSNTGEVFIARFHSFGKWTFEPTGIGYVYDKENIIAWMPVPEPYKGE